MNDDRLDRQIRDALEWQAYRDARQAPSLATSTRRVAERLASQPARRGPLMSPRPSSHGGFRLLLQVVLLLVTLAAGVAIGSQLIRPPRSVDPPPFGFGGACVTPLRHGVVFTVQTAEYATTLYEDGVLVTDRSVLGETKLSSVTGIDYFGRRLSATGIQTLKDRIAHAGVTAGCRSLRTREFSGSISAATLEGAAELVWHPDQGRYLHARQATDDEEVSINELAEALEHAETWLPDEAWLQVEGQAMFPDRWLVFIGLLPTDHRPGVSFGLPNGIVLEGSDPRYAMVDLPGGQELATFGNEMPFKDRFAPGLTERCGVLDRPAAVRLAESLDSLVLGADGVGEVFTTDLSRAVSITIAPAFPDGYDCAAAIDSINAEEYATGPSAASEPPESIAGISLCQLMSESVDALLGGVDFRRLRPAALRLGAASGACALHSRRTMDYDQVQAVLTLHVGDFDDETAAKVASAILGGEAVADTIQGRQTWVNECLAAGLPCSGAIVVWSDPYLIIVEFGRDDRGARADITLQTARMVVEDVLGNMPD